MILNNCALIKFIIVKMNMVVKFSQNLTKTLNKFVGHQSTGTQRQSKSKNKTQTNMNKKL